MEQINPFSMPPDIELSIEGRTPEVGRALIERQLLPGGLAILATTRRASSRVRSFAAAQGPGSSSKLTQASACPLALRTI